MVQDAEDGCQMVMHLLRDRISLSIYQSLSNNPTKDFLQELDVIFKDGLKNKLISQREYRVLWNSSPTIPMFYALPKVHKKVRPIPGRPIVSGKDSITQGISQYIDQIISPFVVTLPSYLRDTKDVVTRINDIRVKPGTFLASLDVEALYSNIDHTLEIQAISHFLYLKSIAFIEHNDFVI